MSDKTITGYARSVERCLDLPRMQRKKVIAGLKNELEESFDRFEGTAEEFLSGCGAPEQIASALLNSISSDVTVEHRVKAKRRTMALVIALAAALVTVVALLVISEKTQVARAEVEIIKNEITTN